MFKANRILLLFLFFVTYSCSGYRVVRHENPLKSYGIRSISVPMFLNKSIVPGISGPMTTEIINELNRYSGLKIYTGENSKADSILIGIVSSFENQKGVFSNESPRFIPDGSNLKNSIGNRNQFYIRSQSRYSVSLRLILIKNPTFHEKKLAASELAKYVKGNPKVIFNEVLTLSSSFSNAQNSNLTPDDGGVVNYTQSRGVFRESVRNLARSAAESFKGVVFNAF